MPEPASTLRTVMTTLSDIVPPHVISSACQLVSATEALEHDAGCVRDSTDAASTALIDLMDHLAGRLTESASLLRSHNTELSMLPA